MATRFLAVGLVLGGIVLAGCVDKEAQNRARLESYKAKCSSYGYRVGSDKMTDCIAAEARAYEQHRSRVIAAIIADDD